MKQTSLKTLKRIGALVLAFSMSLALLSGCGQQGGTSGSGSGSGSGSDPGGSTSEPENPVVDQTGDEYAPDFKLANDEGEVIRVNRTAVGDNGVVTSGRVEASRAGLEIIEMGGNAVDAAVAVSFALGVCEPAASGMGGGTLMMIHTADGENVFLDGREFAPMAATPDLWPVDEEGKVIDNVKTESGKAVCVPTNVATLLYALENYGSGNVTREQVIAPAIRIATEGYEVSINLNSDITNSMTKLKAYNNGEAATVFLREDGFPYEVGETIKNPDIANTLTLIAEQGLAGFYEGEVAEKMVEAVQESGGVMTLDDLKMAAECQPIVRDAITGTYRDYTIIAPSPVSSGGTHIIEMLNILENFDMSYYAQNSAEYMSLLSEVLYMAFADRAAFMGDPAFQGGGGPVAGLTSKEYAADRAEEITIGVPGEYEAGDPFSYDSTAYTEGSMSWNGIVTGANATAAGAVVDENTDDTYESTETTHFAAADKDGNMVSSTPAVNGYFGSGVMGEGLGFPMNNQCSDFGIGWGLPNSIEGGKKPLSSMSPSMVLDPDGDPFLVLGSPGGTHIFPTVMQCIIGAIDYGLNVEEMVNAPRIWYSNGGVLQYETRIAQSEIDQMTEWGYEVSPLDDYSRSQGSVNAIMYGNDGKLYGMADHRRDGKALGY